MIKTSCPGVLCLCCLLLMQCGSGLDSDKVRELFANKKVYPLTIEQHIFCNSDEAVSLVHEKGLVKDGFVNAQYKHTKDDIGKPLITFTSKSQPYLLPTSDTLQSFDIRKVKIADEVFKKVVRIEVSRSGKRAVVDYTTTMENPTPFAVLYVPNVNGEHKRRTFFALSDDEWQWEGKIIRMP